MTFDDPEFAALIAATNALLVECQIPVRDTWDGIDGHNLDDFFSNGERYDGPRRVRLVYKDEGHSDTSANRVYQPPGFHCRAYDGFTIQVPRRLASIRHNIVHEIVHFLQQGTMAEEATYIPYNGSNYWQYVAQRVEEEAHFIQCVFIARKEPAVIQLPDDGRAEFIRLVENGIQNPAARLTAILYAHANGVL